MRAVILIIALAFLFFDLTGKRRDVRASMANIPEERDYSAGSVPIVETSSARVDFDEQIKPILQSKCMPCHFQGGKMYESLPFDRPQTIRKLGTKLFTRINDENQRRVIREFLSQPE